MPLVKVIRHGFVFEEMTPAPAELQLEELPERGRDREQSSEHKEKVSRGMMGNQNRSANAQKMDDLVNAAGARSYGEVRAVLDRQDKESEEEIAAGNDELVLEEEAKVEGEKPGICGL